MHEDEAVAGLISARPLGDVLHTVVLDRGGAPLHFLLAHFALAIDTTPETLRWVSVVFALATLPLSYDLARRIAGRSAGLIAAALAATSQLVLIYGTFGRMYSLFAFASALAADLFVRALERPQRRAALTAAAAGFTAAGRASIRRVPVRGGGCGGAVALARPFLRSRPARARGGATRGAALARGPAAFRAVRAGGGTRPRQRYLGRNGHSASARRRGGRTRGGARCLRRARGNWDAHARTPQTGRRSVCGADRHAPTSRSCNHKRGRARKRPPRPAPPHLHAADLDRARRDRRNATGCTPYRRRRGRPPSPPWSSPQRSPRVPSPSRGRCRPARSRPSRRRPPG